MSNEPSYFFLIVRHAVLPAANRESFRRSRSKEEADNVFQFAFTVNYSRYLTGRQHWDGVL